MEAKKKREFSFWGLRRGKEKCGELLEENRQIRDLPKVGTRVVVHECVIYSDTRSKYSGGMVTGYKPSENFHDVWGYPAIYKVVSYSLGRERALDRRNSILLERRYRNGYVEKKTVSAMEVAIGALLLQEVESEEDAQKYRSKVFSYRDCVVREMNEDLIRNVTKRGMVRNEKAG